MATTVEQKLSAQGTILFQSFPSGNSEIAKPTVVFIHNMWGSHKTGSRHAKMFNAMGFPCVTFDLYKSTSMATTLSPQIKLPPKFLSNYLEEQITDVLDSISGDKIIFAFSGPSMCAFAASYARKDIKAFICDGGPFKNIWACTKRMFAQLSPIPTDFLHGLMSAGACWFWGPGAYERFQQALRHWPPARPILSIRGLKDPIVFPENIAAAFANHPHLPLSIFNLPEGGHIDGLKKFPKDYEEAIKNFMASLNH